MPQDRRMIRKIKKVLVDAPARTAAQAGVLLGVSTDAAQKMLWRLVSQPVGRVDQTTGEVISERNGASPHVSASGALDNAATTYSWLPD